jgi:hypothetical protein
MMPVPTVAMLDFSDPSSLAPCVLRAPYMTLQQPGKENNIFGRFS